MDGGGIIGIWGVRELREKGIARGGAVKGLGWELKLWSDRVPAAAEFLLLGYGAVGLRGVGFLRDFQFLCELSESFDPLLDHALDLGFGTVDAGVGMGCVGHQLRTHVCVPSVERV